MFTLINLPNQKKKKGTYITIRIHLCLTSHGWPYSNNEPKKKREREKNEIQIVIIN